MNPLKLISGAGRSPRPSLNIVFGPDNAFDSRITFTRASTATRTNANGLLETVASGSPRIDYAPVTLACKGLLIEESRTNLLTYSEQFDNAAWSKTRSSITPNVATAPDGTVTADKLVENTTATATHQVSYSITKAASAITYTGRICAKNAERTEIAVLFTDFGGNDASVLVNLSTGATSALATSGTFASASAVVTQLPNGWWDCKLTATSSTSTTLALLVRIVSAGNIQYTGDGTSGLYIWGAQLEAGSFPTSYIPTTSAQVTRAADSATMTGTNFSSWYRQDEFTSVVRFIANAVGTQVYAKWNDTTANEEIKLESVSGTLTLTITDDGVAQAALALGSVTTGTTYTVAAAWKLNDIAASINGGAVVTDTSATLPTPTQRVIGSNSYVRGYPSRLANATLVALSTQ